MARDPNSSFVQRTRAAAGQRQSRALLAELSRVATSAWETWCWWARSRSPTRGRYRSCSWHIPSFRVSLRDDDRHREPPGHWVRPPPPVAPAAAAPGDDAELPQRALPLPPPRLAGRGPGEGGGQGRHRDLLTLGNELQRPRQRLPRGAPGGDRLGAAPAAGKTRSSPHRSPTPTRGSGAARPLPPLRGPGAGHPVGIWGHDPEPRTAPGRSGPVPRSLAPPGGTGGLDPDSARSTSAGVVARLSTRERGLYAVRFEELFGPGGRAVSSSKLRLSRQGEAVGFHLEPEGRGFSRGSVLYFVGEASTENPYGEAAVFEVSLEGGGARMPEESASPRGVSLGHYTHETRWEQDLKYQPGLVQAEDPWLWDALVSPATKAYPLAVSGLVSASEPARLRVWLEGGSDFAVSPDHHLRLSVNGYLVAETSWDGKESQEIEALLPPGVLLEGPKRLRDRERGRHRGGVLAGVPGPVCPELPAGAGGGGGGAGRGLLPLRRGGGHGSVLGCGASGREPGSPALAERDLGHRAALRGRGRAHLPGGLPRGGARPGGETGHEGHAPEPEERGGVPAAGPAGAPGARLRGRAAGAPPGPGAQCPGGGGRGRLRRVRPRRGPAGGPQGVPGLRLPLLAGAVAAVRLAAR